MKHRQWLFYILRFTNEGFWLNAYIRNDISISTQNQASSSNLKWSLFVNFFDCVKVNWRNVNTFLQINYSFTALFSIWLSYRMESSSRFEYSILRLWLGPANVAHIINFSFSDAVTQGSSSFIYSVLRRTSSCGKCGRMLVFLHASANAFLFISFR